MKCKTVNTQELFSSTALTLHLAGKQSCSFQADTFQTMQNSLTFVSLTVHGTPVHVKCYSYHASASVLVSSVVGMQQCMIRNQNEMHKLSKVKNGCKYAANNKQF